MSRLFSFFFQAEDGIRDVAVTGVQTCALPICGEEGGGLMWCGSSGSDDVCVCQLVCVCVREREIEIGRASCRERV